MDLLAPNPVGAGFASDGLQSSPPGLLELRQALFQRRNPRFQRFDPLQ